MKQKWRQKNVTIASGVSSYGLMSRVLCGYSCILLGNGYMTGFMSRVLCLYSCTVLCDYVFSVISLRSCGNQCCNLVQFKCERVLARD